MIHNISIVVLIFLTVILYAAYIFACLFMILKIIENDMEEISNEKNK